MGKKSDKVFACHRCGKFIRTLPVFVVPIAGFDEIAYCVDCVKRGYLELISIPTTDSNIQVIIDDFRKFLKKNKINVES